MRFFVSLCLLFSLVRITAQDMNGQLVDSMGIPVEGAYIFNHRSQAHAHSDENGFFKISQTIPGDTLRMGALGFKKIVVQITEQQTTKRVTWVFDEAAFELNEVVIRPTIDALKVMTEIDLQTQPVRSSQEILQKVPGLIIGQHAGGGKAEQLFLRGFDIDHGTDIAISVDGLPVNLVSHAHGQGYADLHFVIPETIKNIDFGKGPYNPDKGNFATAGYVGFKTKDVLGQNTLQLEYGDFGFNRTLGLFNFVNTKSNKAYMATELVRFDGPYVSPQNFSRWNLFGKYTARLVDDSSLSATLSHFTSTWDASGQIPQRAVDNGTISRFGAIDDTEGGQTSRSNLNLSYHKLLGEQTLLKANTYFSQYNFELFSNFTFFLEDAENGDQIKQRETRNLFGMNVGIDKKISREQKDIGLQSGVGFRTDAIDNNELSRTINRRTTLENIQLGDVSETNLFGYLNLEFPLGNLLLAPGFRVDHFSFGYVNTLSTTYDNQTVDKILFSPKLNIIYHADKDVQFFLKSGMGFHSNDSRVSVARSGETILPRAYGVDVGTLFRPHSKLLINTAIWYLLSEQEFVYVGDAGIVEPSGKSRRYGLDFGLRYQLTDWLFMNTDLTYTKARAIEEPQGNDFIPLAPDFTFVGGFNLTNLGKFSGGLRYRYLDDRPANEDNSIIAEGYLVFDANLNYQWSKNFSIGVSIENLFDTEWNETQFATTSRLQNEPTPINEIHFTPGTPFFVKTNLRYTF
ncbi:TonB-dependent receptor [Flavobacteriaceae bacterium TP-CH-4]|uniref:TonB-dependent receptor n=1 Tax=Pelagihabitans pacificus TaxID=2696054 RepID=A0A967B2Y4_9FLAO|nr:TonB-dependent receptor [Pelagihabitans pacificus]NHF61046.1 TonB-dependent receptor [Pelagihabitans pacificus]